MNFIGIDPGKSGGIGIVRCLGFGTEPQFHSLKLDGATERDIWDFVYAHTTGSHAAGVIEKVASTPQMGVVSSFTFGRSLGFLRGVLVGAGIPFDEVSPQKWQKFMGCLTKGDKNVSKAKAQQLFPSVKITHANADALLLAEYCRRTRV